MLGWLVRSLVDWFVGAGRAAVAVYEFWCLSCWRMRT